MRRFSYAQTFDNISDASLINFQLLRAQLLLNWIPQPSAPPPLRLLRVPYELFTMVSAILSHVADSTACGRSLFQKLASCGCNRFSAPVEPLFGKERGLKLPLGEFKSLEQTLHAYTLEYTVQREDEVGAEDRWRIQLNKSITSKVDRSERALKAELELVGRWTPTRLSIHDFALLTRCVQS